MIQEYQVLARVYRPHCFSEIIGQEAIVTTLKNALHLKRIAHAYLFSGPHGTGKTTFARIFAKILNCDHPTEDNEPCNQCSSCQEINKGNSLNVLEIDGASNRGIDDIRQITETVGYSTSKGKYKIFIIDEIHMLTKEAFNALLKTLEEPPPKVKFFFATTEPHKLLSTILSRCQRFNLVRIPYLQIKEHLLAISKRLNVSLDEESSHVIAKYCQGSLRDAFSLFDQLISFNKGRVTKEATDKILGLLPIESLFAFDKQAKKGHLDAAVKLVQDIFDNGHNLTYFIEQLFEHFRTILLCHILKKNTAPLILSDMEWERYQQSLPLYSKDRCLIILKLIQEAQQQIKSTISKRVCLELLLIQIIESHQRIRIDDIVKKLVDLEQSLSPNQAPSTNKNTILTDHKNHQIDFLQPAKDKLIKPSSTPSLIPKKTVKCTTKKDELKKQSRYDTIMQFAAIELEGSIKKNY